MISCPKCINGDIKTTWCDEDRKAYGEPCYTFFARDEQQEKLMEKEHLHYYCRTCGYEELGPCTDDKACTSTIPRSEPVINIDILSQIAKEEGVGLKLEPYRLWQCIKGHKYYAETREEHCPHCMIVKLEQKLETPVDIDPGDSILIQVSPRLRVYIEELKERIEELEKDQSPYIDGLQHCENGHTIYVKRLRVITRNNDSIPVCPWCRIAKMNKRIKELERSLTLIIEEAQWER